MENASKALYIAASVFVAVLILSLLVMTFTEMKNTQKEREKAIEEKNLAAFNAEYEAFNKRLMYGADIISCINKAISNNSDAERNNDPDLYINVQVKLINNLKEDFEILEVANNGRLKKIDTGKDNKEINWYIKNDSKNDKMSKIFPDIFTEIVDPITNTKTKELKILTSTNAGTILNDIGILVTGTPPYDTATYSVSITALSSARDYYKLLDTNGKPTRDSELYKLVKTQEEYRKYILSDNYCIQWSTVFKKFRKTTFKCVEVDYNEDTGKVNNLVFEEYIKKKK